MRRIVHADFDGTEYRDEYVHLLTNDLVITPDVHAHDIPLGSHELYLHLKNGSK